MHCAFQIPSVLKIALTKVLLRSIAMNKLNSVEQKLHEETMRVNCMLNNIQYWLSTVRA